MSGPRAASTGFGASAPFNAAARCTLGGGAFTAGVQDEMRRNGMANSPSPSVAPEPALEPATGP